MKTTVMYCTLLLLAGLIFCPNFSNAQDQPHFTNPYPEPDTSLPVTNMTFEEMQIDFDTVEEGTVVSRVFTFMNTGNEPLILIRVKGSCGCTVPQYPTEPIKPGETASLTVEFNSRGKRGSKSQKVTITANTNPPQTFLYIQGYVKERKDNDISIFNQPEKSESQQIDPDCFAIFPNPTAEILKLEVTENNLGQRATVSILSQTGQVMAKREITNIEGTIEFNVSHYPAGTYYAKVQIGKNLPETRCFVVVE